MADATAPDFDGRLDWPECRNARDIGGLPARDGASIRRGALIRTDSLDRLTPAGIALVRDVGVSLILDIRSSWEFGDVPHPFVDDPVYRWMPFIDGARDHERDAAAERSLADLYRGSIDRNGRCIASLVAAIATAPPGAVVVHCLSGADRTGMLVALILDSLDVPRAAIGEDYARTRLCLGDTPRAASGPLADTTGADTILETLRHIDHRWGDATTYLRRHGVSRDHMTRLQRRFIEPREEDVR
jgi:protein-tyrosine phosphatase